MMTFFEASRDLNPGDVLVNDEILESYPNYFIRPGARFVVVENDLNEMHASMWLRLVDQEQNTVGADALDEWYGCVVIYDPFTMGYSDEKLTDEELAAFESWQVKERDCTDPKSAWQQPMPGSLYRDNSRMGELSRMGHVEDYRDRVKADREAVAVVSEPVAVVREPTDAEREQALRIARDNLPMKWARDMLAQEPVKGMSVREALGIALECLDGYDHEDASEEQSARVTAAYHTLEALRASL